MNQTAELNLRYSNQFWVLDIKTNPAHCGQARGPAAREGAGNHPSETQENTERSSNSRVFREGQENCPILCTRKQKSQTSKLQLYVEKNMLFQLRNGLCCEATMSGTTKTVSGCVNGRSETHSLGLLCNYRKDCQKKSKYQ